MEEFRDISGYDGMYQVSNLGRVKSFMRGKEYIFKGGINSRGYKHVSLTKNGGTKTKKVHQLVAMAFLNHKPCGMELVVDHINDDKLDNRLDNLQIVTSRFNICKTQGRYTSKYKGVSYKKSMGKFQAYINVNNKIIHLGTFTNEKEASNYYENAVKAIENGKEIIVKRSEHSSKYKGVHWCKRAKKWIAKRIINGNLKSLGNFKCELAAIYALKNN